MRQMKNSGVHWLQRIPDNWSTSKLLYCLRAPISDGPHETPNVVEDGIPFISVDSLNETKKIDFSTVKKFITQDAYIVYKQKANLEPGDILFTKAATIGKTAIVGNELFMVWSPLAIIKSNPDIIVNDYLYYLLNCTQLIDEIRMSGSFNTQANVGMREMERAIVPIPSLSEQRLIADFLDQKCSQIDEISRKIQKEIETLEEYKKSIITEAVTTGLDPNVEMKDSGVEWLGEIPITWKIDKGKFIFSYLQKPVRESDGVITCFRDGEVTLRSNRRTEGFTESLQEIGYQGIDVGDLIVHGMDGFAGSIGISDSRGKASPVLNNLGTNQNKRYFMYFLRTMAWKGVFLALATGIRVRTCDTNWGKLRDIVYALPPIAEQEQIADYIDKKSSSIASIITKKKRQLNVLEDYKKSLIYEYITGKEEVPLE